VIYRQIKILSSSPAMAPKMLVDISYVAPQAHRIINVALHWEYSPSIVFIVSQGRKDGDKDYNEFKYRKPLVTKQVQAKLIWPLRRLHEWYYFACVCGLQFIEGRIPEVVFKSRSFDINIEMLKLHSIY
jgi:hypothetical protein